jgi:hypothetical protein
LPSLNRALLFFGLAACITRSVVAGAQTDFYNTDRGRPVQIEDAYVTERYAFELKLAPVRLTRLDAGTYNWGLEPEIALGILPRTQIELGLPLAYRERDAQAAQSRSGIAGLELSAMHNFNTETEGIPALGLRADVLAPVGSLGPDRVYSSLKGIATRTYPWARFHANVQYTAGAAPSASSGTASDRGAGVDVSRWLLGAAVDKSLPLQSTLFTAELYGRKPLDANEAVEFTIGTGTRFQLFPELALDWGVGRRLNGIERGWYVTFGSAYAFGVRSLFPGGR